MRELDLQKADTVDKSKQKDDARNAKPGHDAHNGGHPRKGEDDFLFLPAAHLKVMVDGRHFEQPLTVGQLEVANLQNHRQGFTDVNKAHKNQNQGHVQGNGHGTHHAAEKQ